jgi:hypothetical protein
MAKKKMPNKKQTLQNLPQHVEEQRRIFCDRAFVVFGKDHFVLAIQSGNSMDRQYALTPELAQNLSDLLVRQINAYKASKKAK